jgi:hypothetical protein
MEVHDPVKAPKEPGIVYSSRRDCRIEGTYRGALDVGQPAAAAACLPTTRKKI